jgi:hypothetical protein
MDDIRKTKEQLIEEMAILHQRVVALETTKAGHASVGEVLQQLSALKVSFTKYLQMVIWVVIWGSDGFTKKALPLLKMPDTAEPQPQALSLTPGGTVMIRPGWYLHWCMHCLEPFRSKDPEPERCGRRACRKKGWQTGIDRQQQLGDQVHRQPHPVRRTFGHLPASASQD